MALHKFLMDLPAVSPQHPLHASRTLTKRGVDVPYVRPLPTEETNWKVSFEKPSEILLAGSWATKTAVKGKDSAKYEVDVAVEMPSVCLLTIYLCTACIQPLELDSFPGERLSERQSLPEAGILHRRDCSRNQTGKVISTLRSLLPVNM